MKKEAGTKKHINDWHDCYELLDYHAEERVEYQPSQGEIDQGKDKDEVFNMAVCNYCDKDMPEIEL